MAQADIDVHGDSFPVTAFGELATTLSEIPPKSTVAVEGRLVLHRYGVRNRLLTVSVELESVEVLSTPQRGLLR